VLASDPMPAPASRQPAGSTRSGVTQHRLALAERQVHQEVPSHPVVRNADIALLVQQRLRASRSAGTEPGRN